MLRNARHEISDVKAILVQLIKWKVWRWKYVQYIFISKPNFHFIKKNDQIQYKQQKLNTSN